MSDTAAAPAPPPDGTCPQAAPWGGYETLVWCLTVPILVGVAGFALFMAYRLRSKNRTQEDFITARGQVSKYRIAWTFFAGALGAWVVASAPNYASYAGMLGLVFYSLSSGLPVIMTAFAGGVISKKMPNVLSLTDYMGFRYGYVVKTYVVLLCMFNMCIALLAEYSTIGSLWKYYLGGDIYGIVVLISVLTMIYTTFGGLLVSIITDQIQGAVALVLAVIAAIYLAAKFDAPLPTPMPDTVSGVGSNVVSNRACMILFQLLVRVHLVGARYYLTLNKLSD